MTAKRMCPNDHVVLDDGFPCEKCEAVKVEQEKDEAEAICSVCGAVDPQKRHPMEGNKHCEEVIGLEADLAKCRESRDESHKAHQDAIIAIQKYTDTIHQLEAERDDLVLHRDVLIIANEKQGNRITALEAGLRFIHRTLHNQYCQCSMCKACTDLIAQSGI